MADSHSPAAGTPADVPHEAHHAHDHVQFAHPTPVWQLFAVFGALIALTILTVSTGSLGLGQWEIVASLAIAFVKATLVAMFFMHLIHDKPFNQMLFVFSLGFIALFIGFTVMDSQTYRPLVKAREEDKPFVPPPIDAGMAGSVESPAAGEAAPGEANPAQTSDSAHAGDE